MTAVQARQSQVGPGTDPVRLPANQFPHFYAGGERISRFRGGSVVPGSGTAGGGGQDRRPDNRPEDWVASTTTRFGQPEVGLSRLPDGRLLREVIAADPLTWLGPAHLAAFGAELNLLVKLLDAGQRLIVHTHPDVAFAGQHLARATARPRPGSSWRPTMPTPRSTSVSANRSRRPRWPAGSATRTSRTCSPP